jgi:hypothetical protein
MKFMRAHLKKTGLNMGHVNCDGIKIALHIKISHISSADFELEHSGSFFII